MVCKNWSSKFILTDNGTSFTSTELYDYYKSVGISPLHTPVYSPRSNGLAERYVGLFKENLRTLDAKNGNENKIVPRDCMYKNKEGCIQIQVGYENPEIPEKPNFIGVLEVGGKVWKKNHETKLFEPGYEIEARIGNHRYTLKNMPHSYMRRDSKKDMVFESDDSELEEFDLLEVNDSDE